MCKDVQRYEKSSAEQKEKDSFSMLRRSIFATQWQKYEKSSTEQKEQDIFTGKKNIEYTTKSHNIDVFVD